MLTQSWLKEFLEYKEDTGEFFWKKKPAKRIGVGSKAGTLYRGRYVIGLLGKTYRMHRVIWLYVHGEWPKCQIDHINGDPMDNSLANLRDASPTTNKQNTRKPMANNKLGVLGVCKEKGRFRPYLKVNNKKINFPSFETQEEAYAVYLKHKRELHQGCTI